MKKLQFATGEIYHIYNRGVEKRDVFMNDGDYFRFMHDLYEFNDEAPAESSYYKLSALQSYEVRPRRVPRRPLVDIIAYCLMPNHFHILLRQRVELGIVRFMQKLGGYTMYFNQRHERVGALFQGRSRAVHVSNERHLLYLPHYIHLNPLDLVEPGWRKQELKDRDRALAFLDSYRWSSYLDYTGKKNFPSILSLDLFHQLYGTPEEYSRSLREWLMNMDLGSLRGLTFD